MQQATLTLHRQREMLMRMKIMQINALRGLLYEFGATFARGKKALLGELELALEALANSIPQYVVDSPREQAQRIKQLAMSSSTQCSTLPLKRWSIPTTGQSSILIVELTIVGLAGYRGWGA